MTTGDQLNKPHARLPDTFRPFFWSYRFEDLDLHKNEKTVIVNLVNYGNLTPLEVARR